MPRPAAATSWERVSRWYGAHLKNDDFLQRDVVIPQTLALLSEVHRGSHLDIACGEGTFLQAFRRVFPQRAATGVDAAPSLIRTAQAKRIPQTQFFVGDAQHLPQLNEPSFMSASCILAIQNITNPKAVFKEASKQLTLHAPLVVVMNHPCFRQPRQSGWGWDEERKIQYRRIDRYLQPYEMQITAHPGKQPSLSTPSYHHPLSFYVTSFVESGFVIDALEEWTSPAHSDSGPRAKAENISRQEIPLFLAIRARKAR